MSFTLSHYLLPSPAGPWAPSHKGMLRFCPIILRTVKAWRWGGDQEATFGSKKATQRHKKIKEGHCRNVLIELLEHLLLRVWTDRRNILCISFLLWLVKEISATWDLWKHKSVTSGSELERETGEFHPSSVPFRICLGCFRCFLTWSPHSAISYFPAPVCNKCPQIFMGAVSLLCFIPFFVFSSRAVILITALSLIKTTGGLVLAKPISKSYLTSQQYLTSVTTFSFLKCHHNVLTCFFFCWPHLPSIPFPAKCWHVSVLGLHMYFLICWWCQQIHNVKHRVYFMIPNLFLQSELLPWAPDSCMKLLP